MSSFVGGSRVSIPGNVRRTIHDIREITGKQHSDDEIYAVLKECSMDPNETAQKLLYLDTFHEVKRKRDRKKENFNGKAAEERPTTGFQRRGSRGGGQGNYASNFSSDAGGGKNYARRENGAPPFLHRGRNNAGSRAARASTALPNGSATLSNGYASKTTVDSEGQSHVRKLGLPSNETIVDVTSSPALESIETEQEKFVSNSEQTSTPVSLPVSDIHSSLDSLSAPSLAGHSDGSMVDNEVGSQQSAVETNHYNENNNLSDYNVELDKSESDEAENGAVSFGLEEKIPTKMRALEPSQEELAREEVVDIAAEVRAPSVSELNVSSGQHVTFPVHFQVPEALKTGLTFGSFDTAFGPRGESVNVSIENGDAAETCEDSDEASGETSPSNENVPAVVEDGYLDNSQSLTRALAKLQPSEDHITSTDSKVEQPKQETQFIPEGPQSQPIINVPNYSLGLMPTMVGNQMVQYEGVEAPAHESRVPIFATGNSFVPPSTNPSPPLPSSIPVSPQPVPVFRQTYPPNFFAYGQYISPFYIPPMHQYLGHNGFAPQPTTGSVYLPPPAAAAGVKFTLPQFKPGNNVGNPPPHIGIQPAGSYITAPIGYAQPVTSGSSMNNDELMASHMKENQIYTTGQQTEGSGVWVHAATGQEMPALQMNSLYNLPHQAHFAFSPQQNAHHAGAFAGMFPPGHAMTAPSTLVQQSQAVAGPIEAIGPPSGAAYQQPQHAQINWNTAF